VHAVRSSRFIQEAAVTALGVSEAAESRVRDYCAVRRDVLLNGLSTSAGLSASFRMPDMFMLVDVRGTGLSGYDFMCELYKGRASVGTRWRCFRRETPRFRARVFRDR